MPSLTDHHSQEVTKVLLLGDSGSGKTGSLISLVEAGFRLIILDYDNGLDYLANLIRLKDEASAAKLARENEMLRKAGKKKFLDPKPTLASRVIYSTLTDKYRTTGGQISPAGMPKAFARGLRRLDNWKTETEEIGGASSWGTNDVLVLDSLTMMSMAALRSVLFIAGREKPEIQDWGTAIAQVESVLGLLYSTDISCNVVVTSHITFVEGQGGGVIKGYATALGRVLPPKIGRYFNAIFQLVRKGSGDKERRIIRTRSQGLVELKSASPEVGAELDINTGLASYFKLVRGS